MEGVFRMLRMKRKVGAWLRAQIKRNKYGTLSEKRFNKINELIPKF